MKHEYGRTTLNPWGEGVNNKAAERNLPPGTVRNAVNVDFRNDEEITCRTGIGSKLYTGLMGYGFSCPLGCYVVEDNSIKKFNSDNSTTTLYSGVTGDTFSFEYLDGVVYFIDGIVSLKIDSLGASVWGLDPPSSPVVYSTTGTLNAGTYLAAMCWVDSSGVESGASEIVSIELGDDEGLVFSNLPASANSLRIYLSTPNGKELYYVTDLVSGESSYIVSSQDYDNSMVLTSMFAYPPPAGRIVRFYNGRMFIADDYGTVFYSDQFNYNLFRLGTDYLLFSDSVDVMEPVKGGIFFSYGSKTEFHDGSVESGFNVVPKYEYGGIYGTSRKVDLFEPESDVIWQSDRGMIRGKAGGACKNIQEKHVAPEKGTSGNTFVRKQDGYTQFIANINEPTTSQLAASSWITAEVVRRSS